MRWFKSKNQRAIEHWARMAEAYRDLGKNARRGDLVQKAAMYYAAAQAYEIAAKDLRDGNFL